MHSNCSDKILDVFLNLRSFFTSLMMCVFFFSSLLCFSGDDQVHYTIDVQKAVEDLQSSKDTGIRIRSISVLERFYNEPGAMLGLRKALLDSDSDVRSSAARALGALGVHAKDAVPELVNRALSDLRFSVQISAEGALSALGEHAKDAVPVLIKMLSDSNYSFRSNAARALGALGEHAKDAVPVLIKAMSDSDSYVRSSAADALGKIGAYAKGAVPVLIKAMSDSDSYVRSSAARALGKIGAHAKDAVPVLIKAMSDLNSDVRSSAAYALIALGEHAKDAVPELRMVLSDSDSFVQASAADALREINRTPQSIPSSLGPKLSSKDFSKQICEKLCLIRKNVTAWSKLWEKSENAQPLASFDMAIFSLQAYFLLKSAPFCEDSNDYLTYVLKELFSEKEKTCSQDFSQIYLIKNAMRRVFATTPLPWGGAEIYGKQFYLLLLQELKFQSKEFEGKINGELERLKNAMNKDLNAVSAKLDGIGGSAFNTYAYVTSILSLPDTDVKYMGYLNQIVEKARDSLTIPYNPIVGQSDSSHRASAARNVPTHLVLYLKDLNQKPAHQKRLFNALREFIHYMPDLAAQVGRGGAHDGADGLAPYYFYPTVPYAAAAIKALLKSKEINPEERTELTQWAELLKEQLFSMVEADGLVQPIGGKEYASSISYLASPAYSNPLLGLSLLPLIQNGCNRKDPNDSSGILSSVLLH